MRISTNGRCRGVGDTGDGEGLCERLLLHGGSLLGGLHLGFVTGRIARLVSVRDPPALPGRHPEFDSSGIGMGKLPHVSRYASRKGSPHDDIAVLNHSKWACQYHVVFIPKYRKKAIYAVRRSSRRGAAGVGPAAGKRRGGRASADHVDGVAAYSVAQVIGYIKGKSAIYIAREFAGRSRSFVGQHFWARGYFVSTLGRDERAIRAYIRAQEQEDRRQEQLRLDLRAATRRVAQVARSGHVLPL